MMIAPVTAATAAATTDGVTPPGEEGFEETMAAILGLAMPAQAQPPIQAALPEAPPSAAPAVPAAGVPVQAPTILPEPAAVASTTHDAAVDVPTAAPLQAPSSTTPPLPHPGVRFPERRVAAQQVAVPAPALPDDAASAEAPVAPIVADEQAEPPVAPRADSTAEVTQAATLPAGTAAVAASAMSTGSPLAPIADAPNAPLQDTRRIGQVGAVGPVDGPGAGDTTRRAAPLEPSMEPVTDPAPVGRTAVEERPVARAERRSVDTPSVPGLPRSETPLTTAEAAPAHVTGHVVDGDAPVPSTMIQRVEDVVRRLENAPPPRSITLSIDDQGLTKVTVSVLSDGVRLTVPEGSQTPNGLVGQLERALESRGFDLSQDGRRKRPQDDQPEAPRMPPAAPKRRAEPDAVVRL